MLLATGFICLALNIYHEARGEPIEGQRAVVIVTMNRAKWDDSKICEQVTKPDQFSWTTEHVDYSSGQPRLKTSGFATPEEQKAWERSLHLAYEAMDRKTPDRVKGANHYHTLSSKPAWRKKMRLVAVIGNHIFYKNG